MKSLSFLLKSYHEDIVFVSRERSYKEIKDLNGIKVYSPFDGSYAHTIYHPVNCLGVDVRLEKLKVSRILECLHNLDQNSLSWIIDD